MLLTVSLLFISCGTYQSAYSNDGIQDDVIITKRQKKALIHRARKNNNNRYYINRDTALSLLAYATFHWHYAAEGYH